METEARASGGTAVDLPTLELRSITKRFGGVTALSGVSLEVSRGEVVAIVGDNGAGKSTLIKSVAGVHSPEEGEIRIEGELVRFSEPNDSREYGIEVVYQDLALAPNLDIATNMFLGRELVRGPLQILRKREMRRQAQEILDEFKIRVPSVRATVRTLSGGQRQGVAIGRATHWGKRLVVMDEPTAALGVAETARVEAIIHRMRERGLAVLIVSHNLDQVFRVADRIYVMRRGSLAGHRTVSETTSNEIVSLITGLA
ncbi:MAG: sugar ABC transporter ATP-binding protein [Nitriliruptoraceae bacterium]|nr:sugar ABC transporter ATP-binding protein [Nitriliruptoraceae bacterium]